MTGILNGVCQTTSDGSRESQLIRRDDKAEKVLRGQQQQSPFFSDGRTDSLVPLVRARQPRCRKTRVANVILFAPSSPPAPLAVLPRGSMLQRSTAAGGSGRLARLIHLCNLLVRAMRVTHFFLSLRTERGGRGGRGQEEPVSNRGSGREGGRRGLFHLVFCCVCDPQRRSG